MDLAPPTSDYLDRLKRVDLLKVNGSVKQVIGLVIESSGPNCALGDVCIIKSKDGQEQCLSEVVGFRNERVLSMILGDAARVGPGSEIVATNQVLSASVGDELLGRVLDGLGHPIDGKGPLRAREIRSIYNAPPNPLERQRICKPIVTGIRSIDTLLTCGEGQRVGIFAGSGVGKSVTLGMIARHTSADVNVIALVGERGREVAEFLDRELGAEGLRRSVVVVATSDQAALIRMKAAFLATTIAEYFRDHGLNVMLLMDSVTRLAMAQREVGLAIGEPPTTKGYTPSVFAMLPKLLERAGTAKRGQHHRNVHGAGRRRRHDRSGRGCRAVHPRRPHRAFAAAGLRGPLSGRRCAGKREPCDAGGDDGAAPQGGTPAAGHDGDVSRSGGSDQHRGVCEREQSAYR